MLEWLRRSYQQVYHMEKAMTTANFQPAGDVFDGWRDDVLTGSPPVLYPIGAGDLARIEIGPGLVTLFGGAPGAGKSALVMQAVTDALRLTPRLRALVCSIEMPPRVLLDRQLARLSGIDLTTIRYRRLTATATCRPTMTQPLAASNKNTRWPCWSTGVLKWSGRESNPRPSHCERDALPTELPPRNTGWSKHRQPALRN